MKQLHCILIFLITGFLMSESSCLNSSKTGLELPVEELLDNLVKKYEVITTEVREQNKTLPVRFPLSVNTDGSVSMVGPADAASGYFPGILWMLYDYSKNEIWKEQAAIYTSYLEDQKFNNQGEGYGPKMISSFGKAYDITGEKRYFTILEEAARSISTNFSTGLGCIPSPANQADQKTVSLSLEMFLNLELLTWTFEKTGDPVYMNIANSHARSTIRELFRRDGQLLLSVEIDTKTGQAISPQDAIFKTAKIGGIEALAKAAYGLTRLFEASQNPEHLEAAERLADYYLEKTELFQGTHKKIREKVGGTRNELFNTEAAAMMASTLIDLSRLSRKENIYLLSACEIIAIISHSMITGFMENEKASVLNNTSALETNTPGDVPSHIMADYFYAEALMKLYKDKIIPS